MVKFNDFDGFIRNLKDNIEEFNSNHELLCNTILLAIEILSPAHSALITYAWNIAKKKKTPAVFFLKEMDKITKNMEIEFKNINTGINEIKQNTADIAVRTNINNVETHAKLDKILSNQIDHAELYRQNTELRAIIKTISNSNTVETHYKTTLENGVLLYEKNLYKKSIESFKRAVKINPNRSEAYACIGSTYGIIGYDLIALSFLIIAEKKGMSNSDFFHNVGTAYSNMEQYKNGLKYYNMAIKVNPKQFRTYCSIARTYNILGRYNDAIEILSDLSDHTESEIYFWHGVSLHMLGYNKKAITYLEQALQINNTGKYHYTLGVLLTKTNQYVIAEEHFKKSIQHGFQLNDSHAELGGVLCFLSKECEARSNFEKAISINPKDSSMYIKKGIGLGILNHNDEALSCFEKAEMVDPTNIKIHLFKGQALLINNNVEMAMKSFQKIMVNEPNDFAMQYNIGSILLKCSKLNESYEIFVNIVNANPKFIDAYYPIITILSKLGRTSLLIKYIENLTNVNPHNTNHLNTIGDFLTTIDLHKYALKYYNLSINKNHNEHAYLWKSISLRHLKNYKESIECIKLAMNKYPNSLLLNEAMAETLLRNGNKDSAIKFIKIILKQDPKNVWWRYNYGVLLEQSGLYDDALNNFIIVAKYDPNHADAHYNISVMYYRKKMYNQAKIYFGIFKQIKTRNRSHT